MIYRHTGNIFTLHVNAIVDPVNCVGVHGRGLAKQIAQRWPKTCRTFSKKCYESGVRTGRVYWGLINASEQRDGDPEMILFFPTKNSWRTPSKIEYIEKALVDLVSMTKLLEVTSISIPALGCGLGNLPWHQVQPLIEHTAEQLTHIKEVHLWEPRDE